MISLTKKEKLLSLLFFLPFYFIFGRYVLSYLFMLLVELLAIPVTKDIINAWFNLFFDGILVIIGLFCFKDYLSQSIKKAQGKWGRIILWSLTIGFAILYLVNIVSGMIVTIISQGATSTNQNMIVLMSRLAPFPMIVSSVILAPILEELVFRVGIFQNLYDWNKTLAYLCSGLTFGMVHILSGLLNGDFQQLLFLFPYGLLGMVFCAIYEKKQSIFVPILVHAANNLLSMLIIFFL